MRPATAAPHPVTGGEEPRRPKVLLACSPGGHLQQMLALESAWGDCDRVWISLRAPDSEALLAGEEVVWAHGPTNRSLTALVRNLPIVWRTIRRVQPDAVLSTGAALALPLILLARLTGRRAVYVESFTRTQGLSFTGRLVYPLATSFFVQWPKVAEGRRRARYEGSVL
jgi:UDP-N-acetylglucosamine:LPS N-acetylglucosamine transferase